MKEKQVTAVESADTPAGFADPMAATPRLEVTVDTLAKNTVLGASFQLKFWSHFRTLQFGQLFYQLLRGVGITVFFIVF